MAVIVSQLVWCSIYTSSRKETQMNKQEKRLNEDDEPGKKGER